MTALPENIKIYLYKTIQGEVSLEVFEKWVYNNKELEAILKPDDYLDLISLNYKKSGAKYDLYNLLKKHIDLGEFETYKMIELLEAAQRKDDKLPFYLMEFYDLYCRGYDFLRDLGLGYGLSVEVPLSKNIRADSWDELNKDQQKELLESFSPELDIEIQRVLDWLKSKKIVPTGEQGEYGHYCYDDFRTEEERKSKVWAVEIKQRKWWQFWLN